MDTKNNFMNKLLQFSQELRLEWDEYFMSTAILLSSRSSCNRQKVGCIIVKDKRIISSGYNGHLPGEPHISIIENNHEQATIHAECNAIADCANRGISVKDSTIYITHYPCINCFKMIAAAGVKHIIYLNDYKNNDIINKLSNNIIIEKL
jgi:dCMP deaminase